MFPSMSRRRFVRASLGAGAIAGVGNFAFLNRLPMAEGGQGDVRRRVAPVSADLEPLVRMIEETPRERILEAGVERIRRGTSHQDLLAALMLAGVRGIEPRPVGFKFHAVLVINAAHMASMAASDRDRWLPLFWALDYFKNSQARNAREGGWAMAPVEEAQLPPAHQARQHFLAAMHEWDEEAADRAVTSFVRSASAMEVIEAFWRLGARDYRDIGHKAIYVANGWRTLQTIGWRHAEPVMRSLAYALLEHEETNPARRDAEQDRPGRENLQRLTRIRGGWRQGQPMREAALEMLTTLRSASPTEASEGVVDLLNREVDPASIWDGVFLAAGELLMRRPGIVGLHCVTTANALYYGYQTAADDETRRYLLLQAAAFMPMFLQDLGGPNLAGDLRADALEGAGTPSAVAEAIEDIFAEVSRDRVAAARKTVAFLDRTQADGAEALAAAARRLVFSRGTDAHDYKFSSAIIEDYFHVSPPWRNRFLATGMFYLRGSGGQETDLYRRIRATLDKA